MKCTSRRCKILLPLIAVPLLLISYILLLFDWNLIKGFAESKASSTTGRTIKISGDIDVDFGFDFSPLVKIHGLSITNIATGTEPKMAEAEYLSFEFNLLSAFKDRPEFPYINIRDGNIVLEKDKAGNANWLFGKKEDDDTETPAIGKLYVRNTNIIYRDPAKGTDFKLVANNAGDFRKTENVEKQFEDFIALKGSGAYRQSKLDIDFSGASIVDIAERKTPYPMKVFLKVGSTELNAIGTITDPYELKGIDLELNVKGKSAADIFPIFGIALLPTPPYDVTGKLTYGEDKWHFNHFKGHMGSSDLRGDLTWDVDDDDSNGARPFLNAKFISDNLNFSDLGAFIGAKKEEVKESPYVIPDVPLDLERLSSMDGKIEFTGKKVISSDLPLDDFYMNIELDNSLVNIKPVKFGTASGDVSANLVINGRTAPVAINGDFEFRKLSLARMLGPLSKKLSGKNYNEGFIGGTAKLKGTGKSLREMVSNADGTIGIGMEGGRLSNLLVELIGLDIAESLGFFLAGDKPVPIRCIVGDFKVKDGTMHSEAIVIDTSDTNIKGKGRIDLETEKMNIELRPRPKDGSILSLKSPIFIEGTLKQPSVNIGSKELLVRGGVAAAASVALTPFVGALAFVEPGLGKDSRCAQLITEMNKDTGKTKANSLIPKNRTMPPKE